MPPSEHVVGQQPAICRYAPPVHVSVSRVPLVFLSVSCPECDRRSLLVGLSAVPPSESRAPPVVPPRNPAPDRRPLSLRACRCDAHPQPSFALTCRGVGGN